MLFLGVCAIIEFQLGLLTFPSLKTKVSLSLS